jgi:hypothetical protein
MEWAVRPPPTKEDAAMKNTGSWVDVLGKEVAYVVVAKANRVQVLVHPTARQLRRRGKRNWSLVHAFNKTDNHGPGLPDEVRDAVMDTLEKLASGKEPTVKLKKANG